jgi:hypothetical protein
MLETVFKTMYNFMRISLLRLMQIVSPSLLLLAILNDQALCAPSNGELEASTDPLLIKAREFDIAFQKPEKANQQKAEEHYIKYLSENPDSPLASFIYANMAHMYTSRVFPDYEKKYSLVRDDAKAMRFWAESVKHHPLDKVSNLLVDAKICLAAGASTSEECVTSYIEYYKWLSAMKKDEIADKLWLSDREIKEIQERPGWKDQLVHNFWSNREQMMNVAATNLVAAANDGNRKIRSQLLDKIIEELPGQEPAKLAK